MPTIYSTPRGEGHIGTITFCLPTDFTGGELVVRHHGQAVTSPTESDQSSTNKQDPTSADPGDKDDTSGMIHWVFLYSDCEHEILPITSGTRISVVYDVWCQPGPDSALSKELTPHLDPVEKYLKELLADKTQFLPRGGNLAFGLRHRYAIEARSVYDDLKVQLKGGDRDLVKMLDRVGLS